ncbi:uncharacterized protein J4E78_000220 [Alternaria triticimaculans]|uniref:uncharacterized protein n=1 Tax=Alternaria triticimaculans TaxID=297637 RepID=UPI0020C3A2EB|nr:uncharacterized protein J4E78_000220 [Alternaria triticimaculans]KAI4671724.1 hypothetical protein J4E78_000220 [Alternaria triticimaculans]
MNPSELNALEAVKSIGRALKNDDKKDVKTRLRALDDKIRGIPNQAGTQGQKRTGSLNNITFEEATESLNNFPGSVTLGIFTLERIVEGYMIDNGHDLLALRKQNHETKLGIDEAAAKVPKELLDYPFEDLVLSLRAPATDPENAKKDKLKVAKWKADMTMKTMKGYWDIVGFNEPGTV